MFDEKDFLKGGVEKEELGVSFIGSVVFVKQVEEEREFIKVEVVLGVDGCFDDFGCGDVGIILDFLGFVVDEEKCWNICKQYWQFIYNVQQNCDDIVNIVSDLLIEVFEEVNVLFDGVS